MQFSEDDQEVQIIHARDPAFRREALRAIQTGLSGHNIAFDMAVLSAFEPEWIPEIFDAYYAGRISCTQQAETLIQIALDLPRGKTNLAAALERVGGPVLDKSDPWRLRYGTLYHLDVKDWPAEAIHYARMDVVGVRFLRKAHEQQAHLLADLHRQSLTGYWLRLLECWGIQTDPARVEEYHAQVQADLGRDRAFCQELGLVRANGTRDTKRAQALAAEAWAAKGEPAPLTDGGQVSLSEDSCDLSGSEALQAYSRVTRATTLLGKVERLRKPLIQASFQVLVATGRTACRQGSDPEPGEAPTSWGAQLQNPPTAKGVRECYRAPDGWGLVSVDYDGFELRTWAQCCLWLCGYSTMAEVLNSGRDPHTELGARLAGVSPEAAYALTGDAAKAFKKKFRQTAKPANFGLPGGMGSARFRDAARQLYGVELTMEEAEATRQIWMQSWPEAQDYFREINKIVGPHDSGTFVHFWSGRIRGGIPYTVACNSPFQGLAADAAKAAGAALSRECYTGWEYENGQKTGRRSALAGCRLVNFIHDEFLLAAPLDVLHEAAQRQAQVQISVAQSIIPDVKITASPAAMVNWSKDAEAVYENGRLVPWRAA
jgi:hypothetical protein